MSHPDFSGQCGCCECQGKKCFMDHPGHSHRFTQYPFATGETLADPLSPEARVRLLTEQNHVLSQRVAELESAIKMTADGAAATQAKLEAMTKRSRDFFYEHDLLSGAQAEAIASQVFEAWAGSYGPVNRPELRQKFLDALHTAFQGSAEPPTPEPEREHCKRCNGRGYYDLGSECGRCRGVGLEPTVGALSERAIRETGGYMPAPPVPIDPLHPGTGYLPPVPPVEPTAMTVHFHNSGAFAKMATISRADDGSVEIQFPSLTEAQTSDLARLLTWWTELHGLSASPSDPLPSPVREQTERPTASVTIEPNQERECDGWIIKNTGSAMITVNLPDPETKALRGRLAEVEAALQRAMTLAREATNGWACYAKRNRELVEIGRLHKAIDALAAPSETGETRTPADSDKSSACSPGDGLHYWPESSLGATCQCGARVIARAYTLTIDGVEQQP